jgi:putative ribosome biogenesis GTPase RsgA
VKHVTWAGPIGDLRAMSVSGIAGRSGMDKTTLLERLLPLQDIDAIAELMLTTAV